MAQPPTVSQKESFKSYGFGAVGSANSNGFGFGGFTGTSGGVKNFFFSVPIIDSLICFLYQLYYYSRSFTIVDYLDIFDD